MEPVSEIYETAKARSEKGINKVLDLLMINDEGNPKHRFKTVSTFNNTTEAIKNIVMGTKGETGSRKVVFGNILTQPMAKRNRISF